MRRQTISLPTHVALGPEPWPTRLGVKERILHVNVYEGVDGTEDDATPIDVVVVNGRRFLPEPPKAEGEYVIEKDTK